MSRCPRGQATSSTWCSSRLFSGSSLRLPAVRVQTLRHAAPPHLRAHDDTHGSAARVAWRCVPCRPCGCRVAAWRGVAWRGVAWRGEALACAVIIGAASANVQTAIQLTPLLFVPQVHARVLTRARALLYGSVLVTGTVCLGWIAAIAATIGIVLVQLLFSGFFIRTQDIPEYMRWIQ